MGVGGSALAALAALLAPRPWMRAEGIRGLISLALLGAHRCVTLAPHELAEAVQQHSDTVPGQCNHLRRLATSLGVSSMSNLANQLGYDGPLELLSFLLYTFDAADGLTRDSLGHLPSRK